MKKNNAIKIILFCSFMLYFSIFILISNPVSAEEPEVWVDDDFDEVTTGWNVTHFNDIQPGINNLEENGTLYIHNGSYLGDVYINKSCVITGENKDNVLFRGQFWVESNNIIIEQLTLRDFIGEGYDFPAAILDMSSNSTYKNLKFINNTCGIEFYDSSFGAIINNNIFEENSDGIYSNYNNPHAVITNNTFKNNVENGLNIVNSGNFTITDNYILNTAETGLTLIDSNNNLIYNNFFDNSFNVYVEGGTNNSFNISKTLGLNIIGGSYLGGNYWGDYLGVDLNGDGLGNTSYLLSLGLYDYHPLVFTHFYVDDDADPSWYDTNHVRTINEAVDNTSSYGSIISVHNGTYDEHIDVDKTVSIIGETVDGVYVTHNGTDTFYIDSPGVMLANMTIADNPGGEGSTAAIYDYSSNAIYTNLYILNNEYGIWLSSGSYLTAITDCIIQNNSDAGIYMRYSRNNLVFHNFIIENTIGIHHYDTENDLIYNNFFDNIQNVNITIEESVYNTSWNIVKTPGKNIIGGPYFGGNYWDNYAGEDISADGIGDSPYLIYTVGNNSYYDEYPLTNNSNTPPTLGTPNPVDESTNNPLELDWTISINDNNGWFSWNISCSNGQNSGNSEDSNGTKTLYLTNLAYSTTYTINVNVTDWHLWVNQTFTFTTKNKPQEKKPAPNQPPVARSGGSYTGHPNERITFNGENSYDPDGYITSYSWLFGDGATAQGEIVSHTYTSQGSYTVTLVVTDDKGKTDSSQSTVVIVKANNPPEIQSSANINPGELSTQLTITVTDKDGDDISGTITWDDGESTAISLSAGQTITRSHTYGDYGSYSIKISANDGTTTSSKTHTISLSNTDEDDSSPQGIGGFSKITTKEEDFIENNIEDRSFFGQAVDNKYVVIPAATAASILLLFLLNLLVEFLSDYSSEHVLDHKRDKQKNKKQQKEHKTFLNKKELLAVFVTTILLALVLTYTWVPDLSMFWSLFIITLVIVAVIILIRESIRCYLCRKHNIQSEFYIWPLGGIMMIVSTLIGNTFSLAANHHYEDNGNIKKCGKVNFTVALFMYLVVAIAFIANLIYNSIILQMIVIVTILNLFIDLFPFKPMDGYETRRWNLPLWAVLYAIVFVSYIVVYFNLYP